MLIGPVKLQYQVVLPLFSLNTSTCITILKNNVFFSILGFEYTNKLQRMFQDVGVSKDLNEQFRTHLQSGGNDPLDIDFQIQVCISF